MPETALPPLLTETKPEDPASQEAELALTLSQVIKIAGVSGLGALRAICKVGETIELPEATPEAAFERVRLRSLGADAELRNAEGGGLSDAEFASQLGLSSRETIRTYRSKERIFGWPKGSRSYRYPAWEIHRSQLLPGLNKVLGILYKKKLAPLAIVSYFLTPSSGLNDVRPLDLLREGKIDEVVADAERYGDIGA